MEQMKRLLLSTLFAAAFAAAAHAERSDGGRFEFAPPESAVEVNRRTTFASTAVDIEVRHGLDYEVHAFSWMAHQLYGNPATASKYIEMVREPMGHEQKCNSGAERFEFQGYPAWRTVCSYSIQLRNMSSERHITESTIAVQRRWGYLVIGSRDDTEFVEQDRKNFDHFVAGIKLLPEPPGNPWSLIGLPVALAVALLGWIVSRGRFPARIKETF